MEPVKQPASSKNSAKQTRRAMERYLEFFPREFDFFGLGRVVQQTRRSEVSNAATAPYLVTFQVSGEEAGLCVVAFESTPPNTDTESMTLELANILASKMVTQLADASCATVAMSPPNAVENCSSKQRLLIASLKNSGATSACARDYEYLSAEGKVRIQLVYLPAERVEGRT